MTTIAHIPTYVHSYLATFFEHVSKVEDGQAVEAGLDRGKVEDGLAIFFGHSADINYALAQHGLEAHRASVGGRVVGGKNVLGWP